MRRNCKIPFELLISQKVLLQKIKNVFRFYSEVKDPSLVKTGKIKLATTHNNSGTLSIIPTQNRIGKKDI